MMVSTARAQPAPATAPLTRPTTLPATTAPTSQPTDLATPRGALRCFATALHEGDAAKLRQVVETTNGAEDRMLGAMADMARAVAELHETVVKAFGDPAAARFTGDTNAQFADSLARIDAADIAIDTDTATVRYSGEKDPQYELKRINGQWRIPIAQFSHGADAATLDRRIVETNVQTEVVRAIAGQIASGKFKTADAAAEAWRSQMMQALAGPPGTRPSLEPK